MILNVICESLLIFAFKYMERKVEFQSPNTLRTVAILVNAVEKELQKM